MSVPQLKANLMAGRALNAIEVGIVESGDQCRQFMSAVIGGTPGLRPTCVCSTGPDDLRSFAENPPGLANAPANFRGAQEKITLTTHPKTSQEFETWPSTLPM